MILTNNKNGFRIYNNGRLNQNLISYWTDFSLVNHSDIILGKQPSSGCFEEIPLNGMIDDFRLYNTSITDEEALGLYSLSGRPGVECFPNPERTTIIDISSRYTFLENTENQYFIDIIMQTYCLYPFSFSAYSSIKDKGEIIVINVKESEGAYKKKTKKKTFTFVLTDAEILKLGCEIDVKEDNHHIHMIRNCSIFFELISKNYTLIKYSFSFLLENRASKNITSKFLLVQTTKLSPVTPKLKEFSYLSLSLFCQDDCENFRFQETYFRRHEYLYFSIWKERNIRRLSNSSSDLIPKLIQANVVIIQDTYDTYNFSKGNMTYDVLEYITLISSPEDYDSEWRYSLFLETFLKNSSGHFELTLTFQLLKKDQKVGSEMIKVNFDVYDDKGENTDSNILVILIIVCALLSLIVVGLLVFTLRSLNSKR